MKRRVSSMKIPCRIWLLAATLSVGQAAFSTEMETISFSTGQDIAQQKKVIEVTGTVTDNFGPVIGNCYSKRHECRSNYRYRR